MSDQSSRSKLRLLSVPLGLAAIATIAVNWVTLVGTTMNAASEWVALALIPALFFLRCGACGWSGLRVNELWKHGYAYALAFPWRFFFSRRCPNCGKERF